MRLADQQLVLSGVQRLARPMASTLPKLSDPRSHGRDPES